MKTKNTAFSYSLNQLLVASQPRQEVERIAEAVMRRIADERKDKGQK